MFIGSKEIKTQKGEDNNYLITLDDNKEEVKINKDLFTLIAREEKGEGDITDNICAVLANKFLIEMADYDLDVLFARRIAESIKTSTENYMENAIGKKFDCNGSLTIKLEDVKKYIKDMKKGEKEDDESYNKRISYLEKALDKEDKDINMLGFSSNNQQLVYSIADLSDLAIGDKFGCKDSSSIKIKDILQ